VVALEAMAAAQGIDLRTREGLQPAPGTAAAVAAMREVVPFLDADRELKLDVDEAIELVKAGGLVEAVERAMGPLG
jgi:histidine ammonia-lyase